MKTQIKIQVIESETGKIQASFRFEFRLKATVILILHKIFPLLLVNGRMICEQLEFPLTVGGVQIQNGCTENKNETRQKDYENTGN